jgi:hypothetical protein
VEQTKSHRRDQPSTGCIVIRVSLIPPVIALIALSALVGCARQPGMRPLVTLTAHYALPSAAPLARVGTPTPTFTSFPRRTFSPTRTFRPTPLPTFTPTPSRTSSPTLTPTATVTPLPVPVRAVRIDFASLKESRSDIQALEQKISTINVNLVALGAGRLDWNYFKWEGHENFWSSDVRDTGIDFLAEDAARFSQWAHVNAVVDVFAPRYIAEHPHAAAVSWLGERSGHLVSTTELVRGEFGSLFLHMLDYIAAHYPIDSVSITELSYYIEGYGDDDKAAYTAYTGRTDWPRNPLGLVNIDDPSIGRWRSYEIGRFLEQAATVVHRYNKKLYVDVEVSWGHLSSESAERGQDYGTLLKYADGLVVWDYFGLSGYPPDYTGEIARSLRKYGANRIIISIGLWSRRGEVISPVALQRAMQAALHSDIPNLWITPSLLLSEEHWQVVTDLWGERAQISSETPP